MKNINRRSLLLGTTAAAVGAGFNAAVAQIAAAQTATPDASLLTTSLTPFGAERAGNADGSIPAWTGGYSTVPAGYVSGQPRPDPFAADKVSFSITTQNVTQYADKVPQGVIEMMKLYPTYRVDVYPTRRSHAMPQYVYDNIALNVTRAQLSADGTAVTGAFGGVPFPIPANGAEVMWNHLTAFQGEALKTLNPNYVVTSSGQKYMASLAMVTSDFPYYHKNGSADSFSGIYKQYIVDTLAPAYQAGFALMSVQQLDAKSHPPKTMEYLPGQRRVREAPDLAYDNPNSLAGGIGNFDEGFVYNGRMDQYDFKLVGKREIFVPYNNNRCFLTSYDVQLGPKHYNPDVLRWELHRVWVVEMTLLPGARNVDARRVMYVDEDTWVALVCDVYDASGTYWKFLHNFVINAFDLPTTLANTTTLVYDLHKGDYVYNVGADPSVTSLQFKFLDALPENYFSSETLVSLQGGN
jgi:hypothetical protein